MCNQLVAVGQITPPPILRLGLVLLACASWVGVVGIQRLTHGAGDDSSSGTVPERGPRNPEG